MEKDEIVLITYTIPRISLYLFTLRAYDMMMVVGIRAIGMILVTNSNAIKFAVSCNDNR